jgi:HAD superfamily hydrolase (TIGR01509 family)
LFIRKKMKYKGIIFDLDGTLVDSEPLHMEAWLSVLANQGLNFDEHWFEQWIGKSDRILAESVVEQHEIGAQVEDLQENKRNTYHRIAAERAILFPEVEKYLHYFKQHLKLGIATNSSKDDAAAVFSRLPLPSFVSAVVTADDVPNLKPAPDMYLLAAERIGLDVSEGLAIEDSPAGLQAAKEAGLFTLGVTNSHPAENLKHADLIFDSTAEAMEWITKQGERVLTRP